MVGAEEKTRFERSENRVRVTSILNGQVAFFLGTNQRSFQGIFSGGVHSLPTQGFPQSAVPGFHSLKEVKDS